MEKDFRDMPDYDEKVNNFSNGIIAIFDAQLTDKYIDNDDFLLFIALFEREIRLWCSEPFNMILITVLDKNYYNNFLFKIKKFNTLIAEDSLFNDCLIKGRKIIEDYEKENNINDPNSDNDLKNYVEEKGIDKFKNKIVDLHNEYK